MIIDGVTFYPIRDFPEYYFSVCNKIYSEKSNKILAPRENSDGYYQSGLYKDGKLKWKFIHRLIAEYFLPNPENLPVVDHKNHIKTDNRPENLRWATRKQNSDHCYKWKDQTKGTYWQGVNYVESNERFRATWYDENCKKVEKSFAINKYGMMALVLAIDKRNEMVDKLYNRPETEIKYF